MNKIILVFGFVLSCFAQQCFAAIPALPGYAYQSNHGTSAYFDTSIAACSDLSTVTGAPTQPVAGCQIDTHKWGGYGWESTLLLSKSICPVNSTLSGSSCVCTSPYSEDSTHTSCVLPDACANQVGVVSTFNVTAGYSRSVSGAGLYPPILPDGSPAPDGYKGIPPASMCIYGCQRARGGVVASWTSLEPTATGLYRQSDDWSFTGGGASCTATPSEIAALKPDAVVPSCVGFLGQVNGKISCVASVGSLNTVMATKPNLAFVGNPAAGTSGGAASIPSTGGNGANAGGPKGSADGSAVVGGSLIAGAGAPKPSGTASAPASGDVQVACGAPGEPQCAIDESGTPAPVVDNVYNSKLDKFKSDADAARGTMAGSADKPFFSGWSVLFSAPPVAACSPMVLPSFRGGESMGSIDPCPVVDGMRYVMGLLWAMSGLVFSLKMIKDVV